MFNSDVKDLQRIREKLKLIVFDLDGTLTKVRSIWQYIHHKLGVIDKALYYKKLYFEKKISYKEWAELDTSLWKGTPYHVLRKMVESIPLVDDLEETINHLKSKYKLAIVTSGLDLIADKFYKIGFDKLVGNSIEIKDGVVTGKVFVNVGFHDKIKILRSFLDEYNLDYEECAVVGDGENDISMFEKAALSIAFNPTSREVEEKSDIVIKGNSLKPLLKIL